MSNEDQRLRQLGKRLRALREELGLTQEAVATRAGYTGKYLSEVERGRRALPVPTLEAIVVDGLGVTLAKLFAELPAKKSRRVEEPLPPAVLEAARAIADLPASRRPQALAALRSIIALAKAD